ncbi:response regulator transcription factor [Agreia bicolorata]|uniref:response regulator transcription factor n=1 Tax=Agreia bicolorata TaxID=110935 RepID=UPI00069683F5|nr:LuxR C-terminal-related transcriptional regulator [Agreia bicolorata]
MHRPNVVAGIASTGPAARAISAVIDLQAVVACTAALLTYRHQPDESDRVLFSYNMSVEQVRSALSALVEITAQRPTQDACRDENFCWSRPLDLARQRYVRTSSTMNEAHPGASFLLVDNGHTIGTMHLRFGRTTAFTKLEIETIDRCRLAVEHETRELVHAADVGLTKRELEVLNILASGASNFEIGALLMLSRHTVSSHLERIFLKLGVTNRVQAVRVALRLGLIDEQPSQGPPPSQPPVPSNEIPDNLYRRAICLC